MKQAYVYLYIQFPRHQLLNSLWDAAVLCVCCALERLLRSMESLQCLLCSPRGSFLSSEEYVYFPERTPRAWKQRRVTDTQMCNIFYKKDKLEGWMWKNVIETRETRETTDQKLVLNRHYQSSFISLYLPKQYTLYNTHFGKWRKIEN